MLGKTSAGKTASTSCRGGWVEVSNVEKRTCSARRTSKGILDWPNSREIMQSAGPQIRRRADGEQSQRLGCWVGGTSPTNWPPAPPAGPGPAASHHTVPGPKAPSPAPWNKSWASWAYPNLGGSASPSAAKTTSNLGLPEKVRNELALQRARRHALVLPAAAPASASTKSSPMATRKSPDSIFVRVPHLTKPQGSSSRSRRRSANWSGPPPLDALQQRRRRRWPRTRLCEGQSADGWTTTWPRRNEEHLIRQSPNGGTN